jgi:hypothetical protein
MLVLLGGKWALWLDVVDVVVDDEAEPPCPMLLYA